MKICDHSILRFVISYKIIVIINFTIHVISKFNSIYERLYFYIFKSIRHTSKKHFVRGHYVLTNNNTVLLHLKNTLSYYPKFIKIFDTILIFVNTLFFYTLPLHKIILFMFHWYNILIDVKMIYYSIVFIGIRSNIKELAYCKKKKREIKIVTKKFCFVSRTRVKN